MAIYKQEEIKDLVVPILLNYNVRKVILFGSYARNEADEDSDIDLYIDSNRELRGLGFLEAYEDVADVLCKELDMFEAVDIKKNTNIFKSIEKEGITLYEK
jgi:predicted nucleotidyltransferase